MHPPKTHVIIFYMLARLKNHLLFFLILITTGAYGWYYLNTFVPNDDSLQVFQNFYYFYSEFFITGNLAQWAPYDSFGTPSTWWQLTALTPISYFAMLIGKVCYVTDTLLLFKFSLLGELLVLLLGAFLLAKKLFQHQTTVAIISLSASLTCYFYSQIFFHLHIYYMLPLLLYYLFTWIDTNKPYLCWLCGILFIFWLLGSPQYFCFLYIPLLLIISLSYSTNKLPLQNLFNPSLRNE